ncbi:MULTISPECIES: methylated-DNA--[protein]-cysteine S-methyltransferase [unclassified Microbacterium]|jgi:methylated-DNA-[protein]-cysteine S-methyltransferase|uniref:methylated-DNA--[protein]-cysteine S-methyltransferase n=1 Tax=unclassified Microbacterium TaxID=2609290 RepID=UPI000C2CBDE7|nr:MULTISPECIES: methylated-DNA--[protein]-cysteine S-methyltransferase [unclassified Microbacterium]
MNAATQSALVEAIDTPDGPLIIVADADQRVLGSGWTTDASAVIARIHPALRPGTVREASLDAAAAARAYYAGAIGAIDDVPVRQHGTDLQLKGWSALRRIAPGEPLTYSQFAAVFGSPTAVRAAASVCARNAPALFVPCHRVLRSDGSLGGFAWGLPVKASLLARERGEAYVPVPLD